ncbi:MAG: GNAT family N-acetyltransferase [Coleofasciculaceae cyanobacterium]
MTPQFEYSYISSPEDLQQIRVIDSQCFGMSPHDGQDYIERLGKENFRLIRQGKQVVGSLAIYNMGQWYGGSCLPMAGIAAVGVLPESRGAGVAYQLMSSTLQELYSQDVPISALYAATQKLYRKVGYEQGGTRCRWRLATASIQSSERHLLLHRVNPSHYEIFQDIYQQQAQINNGNLDRISASWNNLLKVSEKQPLYAYLIGSETQPEGYIIFTQSREADSFVIDIRDWVVLTTKAAQSCWTFLADHRSQIDEVKWYGSSLDPCLLLLPEQTAKIVHKARWMLRIINVPLALSKRGYPLGIEAELHLEIKDDLIAGNNGRFCLKVSHGRGEVATGGNGELQIGARGLASLFTGLFSPQKLQLAGHLQGSQKALLTATFLFAGSEPWMPDFF